MAPTPSLLTIKRRARVSCVPPTSPHTAYDPTYRDTYDYSRYDSQLYSAWWGALKPASSYTRDYSLQLSLTMDQMLQPTTACGGRLVYSSLSSGPSRSKKKAYGKSRVEHTIKIKPQLHGLTSQLRSADELLITFSSAYDPVQPNFYLYLQFFLEL